MEPELNPCPVCGGEAVTGLDEGLYYICCADCGCRTDVYYHPENAVYAWNTNVTQEQNEGD